jgi:hypothetical protein
VLLVQVEDARDLAGRMLLGRRADRAQAAEVDRLAG